MYCIITTVPIFACSASAVTRSEKSSINTNRKSIMRFPMSLRWSSYVAPKPPKGGGSKTQNGRFSSKIAARLKKVCYKVSLCENCQWQSCKAFIGLTIRAKMIGGVQISGNQKMITGNFGSNWSRWSEIADFRAPHILIQPWHIAKKSSVNTNRKSTTRFPMSPRWTSYVVLKPPSPAKGGSKMQCPQFEQ